MMKLLSTLLAVPLMATTLAMSAQTTTRPSELPLLEVEQWVAESLRAIGLNREELLLIDGSTSCQPIVALVRGVALDARWEWTRESENTVALEPRLERKLGGHSQTFGTHAAYAALATGEKHLAIVAREPTAEEIALAAEHGHKFDVRHVARDAFVFLVNDTNPVDDLTLDEIRDIYGGDVRNWRAVGGPDLPVIAAGRDPGSGSLELMQTLVMGDRKTRADKAYRIVGGMAMMPIEVEHNAGAIGYTVHYYNRYMFATTVPANALTRLSPAATSLPPATGPTLRQPHQMPRETPPLGGRKVLAVEGVLPVPQTIRDATYPLVEPVYVVIREGDDKRTKFGRLRDWLLSANGQALVAATGYVPLTDPA